MTQQLDSMAELLNAQQQDHIKHRLVSADQRRKRLQQVIDVVVAHHQEFVEAMELDFAGRSQGFSVMNDILGSLASLKYARDHLDSWMVSDNRQVFSPYDQLGSTARIEYQAKGSVGIIGTWNAPLYTLLSPLACVLAAGNRAILKPSEVTSKTADVLASVFAKELDPLIVGVVNGGVKVGVEFSHLPFDHLIFTGSSAVGKKIMQAAAQNLVPVTLELGGKSPVVISGSCDLEETCKRIAIAKSNNGGQLCISPDIIYVPKHNIEQAASLILETYKSLFPKITNNADVVPIVNQAHCQRVVDVIKQAQDSGCDVRASHSVADLQACVSQDKRLPLHLVIAPAKSTRIMQEEIFGPAAVLQPYDDISDVIDDINQRDKPLALYYFGENQAELDNVLVNTSSGGVSINDCLIHAAMHDAPFGGVGASGMGHYHGHEGFKALSHARTVFVAPEHDPRAEWGLLPPHHDQFKAMMVAQVCAD